MKALPRSARKTSPSAPAAIPEGSLNWPGPSPFTPHCPMNCNDGAGDAAPLGSGSDVAFEHPASATEHTITISAARELPEYFIPINLTQAAGSLTMNGRRCGAVINAWLDVMADRPGHVSCE